MMPSRSILAAVTGPTPWNRLTGRVATNAAPLCGGMTHRPSGLFWSLAQLGDELAVADAGRGGEPGLGLDPGADFLGDRPGAAQPAPVLGDVEIGFVERQRLDQVGIVGEDRADLVATRR